MISPALFRPCPGQTVFRSRNASLEFRVRRQLDDIRASCSDAACSSVVRTTNSAASAATASPCRTHPRLVQRWRTERITGASHATSATTLATTPSTTRHQDGSTSAHRLRQSPDRARPVPERRDDRDRGRRIHRAIDGSHEVQRVLLCGRADPHPLRAGVDDLDLHRHVRHRRDGRQRSLGTHRRHLVRGHGDRHRTGREHAGVLACMCEGWHVGGLPTVKGGAPDFRTDTTAPTPNPSTGSGVANSTTQITWTINAAADTGGVGLHATPYSFDNGATWQAGNTLVQSGLTANTQYSKTIRVRDALGNLTTAATISRYTLPAAPTGLTGTPGWTLADGYRDSLAWTAPAGGAALYVVRWSADGYAGSQGLSAGTARVQQFLAANTSYTYKVCAANADGAAQTTCSGHRDRPRHRPAPPPPSRRAPSPTRDTTLHLHARRRSDVTRSTLWAPIPDCTSLRRSRDPARVPDQVSRPPEGPRLLVLGESSTLQVRGAPSTCTALTGNGRSSVVISVDFGSIPLGSRGARPARPTASTHSHGTDLRRHRLRALRLRDRPHQRQYAGPLHALRHRWLATRQLRRRVVRQRLRLLRPAAINLESRLGRWHQVGGVQHQLRTHPHHRRRVHRQHRNSTTP